MAKKTEQRYELNVNRFLEFLTRMHLEYPCTFVQLDEFVCEYICSLWDEGEPRGWAGDTLSGLGHFVPSCKHFLTGGWRLHGAWGRAELPARALPFTPLLVYALVQLAVQSSWVDTAVLLFLGFHVFPRSGELFQCVKGDFVLDADAGVWNLHLTKSGQRVGAKESVCITDRWIVKLLANFLRKLSPGDKLSSVSPGVQRYRLCQLMKQMSVEGDFRWYSLRRGGATHSFRKSNSMSLVCQIGRWGNPHTARIYITDGLAQLTEVRMSKDQKTQLRRLAVQARPDFDDA